MGLPEGILPAELHGAGCPNDRVFKTHAHQLSRGARFAARALCDPLFVTIRIPKVASLTSFTLETIDAQPDQEQLTRIFASNHLDGLITSDGVMVPEGFKDPILTRLITNIDQADDVRSQTHPTRGPDITPTVPEPEASLGQRSALVAVPISGLRFIDWFVPGLIGLGLMSTGLFFVTSRIVQERQAGFFRRLQLTPFRRPDYLIGFFLAFMFICVIQFVLLTLAFCASTGFGINGNLAAWILVGTLGGLSFGSLGLAIASPIRTIETATGISNVFYFPMMFLSGVYFSPTGLPSALRNGLDLLPLSALNNALREIAAGGSLISVGPQLGVLTIWGLASTLFAASFFKWDTESA